MFGIGQQGQAEEKKGGIFGGGAPAQAHPAKPGSSWLPQCTVAVLSSSSHQDEAATGRSCVSALFAKVQYELPETWEGEVNVDLSAFLGRVVLLVPARAKVKLGGLSLLSWVNDERASTESQDEKLVVRVSGLNLLSSITILAKLSKEAKDACAKYGLVQKGTLPSRQLLV